MADPPLPGPFIRELSAGELPLILPLIEAHNPAIPPAELRLRMETMIPRGYHCVIPGPAPRRAGAGRELWRAPNGGTPGSEARGTGAFAGLTVEPKGEAGTAGHLGQAKKPGGRPSFYHRQI